MFMRLQIEFFKSFNIPTVYYFHLSSQNNVFYACRTLSPISNDALDDSSSCCYLSPGIIITPLQYPSWPPMFAENLSPKTLGRGMYGKGKGIVTWMLIIAESIGNVGLTIFVFLALKNACH